jgi:glutamate--cysteine ligase
MRGADMGDADHVLALSALWVGLLYDATALDAASELIAGWTTAEMQTLRLEVPRTAIHTPFRGRIVADIGDEVLAIAKAGLARRGERDASGADETKYLAPVERVLSERRTPAERWLERFSGPWACNLDPIYDEAEM